MFSVTQSSVVRVGVLLFFLLTIPTTVAAAECECTSAQQQNEIRDIYKRYRDAVNYARTNGYQCGGDLDYIDDGDGNHPVGNCADWAQVAWGALRVKKWDCWKITKIRARKKFRLSFHHFVKIESCDGLVFYLDPWKSGAPSIWAEEQFPLSTGFFGGWIFTNLVVHDFGDAPADPGEDP